MKRIVNFVLTVDIEADSEELMQEAIGRVRDLVNDSLWTYTDHGSYSVKTINIGPIDQAFGPV